MVPVGAEIALGTLLQAASFPESDVTVESVTLLSPFERPVVAVEITNTWRNQNPPGRFLNLGESGLYFDIGDKKAMQRISAALKIRETMVQEEVIADVEQSRFAPVQPDRKVSRRVSTQLDYRREGKLYNRSEQEKELLQAFHLVLDGSYSDRLVLISGQAGIGKTALASTIQSEVERLGGFFIRGKNGQMRGPNRSDAIRSAVADFSNQLASREPAVVQTVREKIVQALKQETALLVNVVPEMEKILGPQEHIKLKVGQGAMAQTRVNYVYRLLIRAIASPEQPIAVLVDDLHWTEPASLELLFHLLTDRTSKGVLFVVTIRSEPRKSSLDHFVERVKAVGLGKHHIRLQGLDDEHVRSLISDVFRLEERQVAKIAEFVSARTGGNVYFLSELLKQIQEEDLLSYDETNSTWTFDEHMIRVSVRVSNVRELFRKKILELLPQAIETLKVASCFGVCFEVRFMEVIFRDHDVLSILSTLTDERLLVKESTKPLSYSFCHDSVQEAAYSLISEKDRDFFHLKIGERLSKLLGGEHGDHFIDVVLDQIIRGKALLQTKQKRVSIANLCLNAGERAVAASNFPLAATYFKEGIDLCQQISQSSSTLGAGDVSRSGRQEPLRSLSYWKDEYTLCLRLHEDAAEVAYCNGQFDEVTKFTKEIVKHARSFDDTLRARGMQVYSLGSVGRMDEAIDEALPVLERLGEKIPINPNQFVVAMSFMKTKRILKGKSDEILLRLAVMTDDDMIATMQMLNLIFIYAFYVRPNLASMVAHRMVQLTVKGGITGMSGVGFGYYSMMLCGSGGSIEEGIRYGALAVKMNESLSTNAWLSRLSATVYGLTFTWKDPVQSLVEPLQYAYEVGLSTGDIEYAFLNACLIIWDNQWRWELSRLESELRALVERLEFYGQIFYLQLLKPVFQTVLNWMGLAKDPTVLTGEVMDYDEVLKSEDPSGPIVVWARFQSSVLSYHFDDFAAAATKSAGLNVLYDNAYGATDSSDALFYETMAMLAVKRQGHSRIKGVLKSARKRLKRLQDWARYSPVNLLPKQLLMEAELALVGGDEPTAKARFMSAVLHAREGGFVLFEAFANERLGDLILARKSHENGKQYLKEARRLYSKWGAVAKVRHLESKHSFLT